MFEEGKDYKHPLTGFPHTLDNNSYLIFNVRQHIAVLEGQYRGCEQLYKCKMCCNMTLHTEWCRVTL